MRRRLCAIRGRLENSTLKKLEDLKKEIATQRAVHGEDIRAWWRDTGRREIVEFADLLSKAIPSED